MTVRTDLGNFDYTVSSQQPGLSYAFRTVIGSGVAGHVQISPLGSPGSLTSSLIDTEWDYTFRFYSGNAAQDAYDWVWILNTTSVTPGSVPKYTLTNSAGTYLDSWPDGDDQLYPNPQFQRPWAPEGEPSLQGGINNTYNLSIVNTGAPVQFTFALVAAPDPNFYKANYSVNTTSSSRILLGVKGNSFTDYFETVYDRTLNASNSTVTIDPSKALVAIQAHYYVFDTPADGYVTFNFSGLTAGHRLLSGGNVTGYVGLNNGDQILLSAGRYYLDTYDSLWSIGPGMNPVGIRPPGEDFEALTTSLTWSPPTDFTASNVVMRDNSLPPHVLQYTSAGVPVSVSFSISNAGLSAGPGNIGIFLSADRTIGPGDVMLGTVNSFNAVPYNGTSNFTSVVPMPANLAPGVYYIVVIPNYDARVIESNYANNASAAASIIVTHAPTGPNAVPPLAATADLVLRQAGSGKYEIYDIGNNTLQAAYSLGQVGVDWKFVALGGFFGSDTADMLLRNSTTGGFEVYDISYNNITNAAFLGNVGVDWQVMGFGNFSSFPGETDMMLRRSSDGAMLVYDIRNNQIVGSSYMGTVGLDWQFAGFGNFSSRGTSDMMLRNVNNGALLVYDINNNQITGAASMGVVGLDWKVLAFGNFSGRPGATDMIMRRSSDGAMLVYDINNNQITSAHFLGTVGSEWQFAGVAPVRTAGESDLVLRNVNTGAFEVYNIAGNTLTGAASLGAVGVDWQLGGFAADLSNAFLQGSAGSDSSSGSTAQLVQAMAGFGGDATAGAAADLNIAASGAEASQQQQQLLTTPQHA